MNTEKIICYGGKFVLQQLDLNNSENWLLANRMHPDFLHVSRSKW
jgi:hypothetical protein